MVIQPKKHDINYQIIHTENNLTSLSSCIIGIKEKMMTQFEWNLYIKEEISEE